MEMLVSTEWLAGELGKPDLVVFDCSTFLPNEPGNKHDAFRAARIPGARLFDIDRIADDETGLPHMVPTPAKFARRACRTTRAWCSTTSTGCAAPRAAGG